MEKLTDAGEFPLGAALPHSRQSPRKGARVLGSHIDALSWDETLETIHRWSEQGTSRYVCICNVHSIVTALGDGAHREALNAADMATPDSMPVTWSLRWMGCAGQQRINGPDLMWKYCERAAQTGQKVFFYGTTEQTLAKLQSNLKAAFPALQIAGMLSPPFRDLTEAEDAEVVRNINASGAGVVFVSLGCPRQERWMFEHRGRIGAVMIGVGAAFAYHAGTIRRAPRWMQDAGLEWLHRLASEPRRLWRRYLVTNTVFILAILAQLLGFRKYPKPGLIDRAIAPDENRSNLPPAAPLSMPSNRTAFIIAALMLAASVGAIVARPSTKVADLRQAISLESMVPKRFGDWREAPVGYVQVVNPQAQQLLDSLYSEVLSRTYVNARGYRIMLSLAYGSDQRGALQAHKPEVCYPAQGFVLHDNEAALLKTAFGDIPVRRLFTTMGPRHEPVTYWFTVGDKAVEGAFQKRWVELRLALTGSIPDGMLFRVSSIDSDRARAFQLQEQFVNELLHAVSATGRQRLSGLGAS